MTRGPWLVLSGLLGLCLWTFAPLRSAGFVYEDAHWQWATAWGMPPSLVAWQFVSWRIWMWRSWAWQAQYTPEPGAFHLVNVGLHLLAAALVGWLVWRLTCAGTRSVVGAGLFALLPVQSETVSYLSGGRPELLAALGVVAACGLALGRAPGRWLGVGGALLFGLLGKETALVGLALVPLVMVLAGRWHGRTVGVGVGLLVALTTGAAWVRALLPTSADWPLVQLTAVWRLLGASVLLAPLTVDYDYAGIPLIWQTVMAIAVVGLALLAWLVREDAPAVAYGLGWIGIVVLPRLLVETADSVLNEHQWYLATVGVVLALVTPGARPHVGPIAPRHTRVGLSKDSLWRTE